MDSVLMTYSGARVDLSDPQPETLRLVDIAHHLSLLCRFGGALREFYSVAQHSLLVLWIVRELEKRGASLPTGLISLRPSVSREDLCWAVLHDAGEAYVGDMVSPVRRMLRGAHHDIEARITRPLMLSFDLGTEMPEIVRVADEIALAAEARDLLIGDATWPLRDCSFVPVIKPWSPKKARRRFLEEARLLGLDR